MKKINKKLLLSTSLLMPILPIFATISCNNKKINEEKFDLTKLETGFHTIKDGAQEGLPGGYYFVLNNPKDEGDMNTMKNALGNHYKSLLNDKLINNNNKPSEEDFVIPNITLNQVAILTEGSTIELSADGPMRPPYAAYMQGGLSYSHVKIALDGVLKELGI